MQISDTSLPDLLFAGESQAADQRLSRLARAGRIRRIVPGVYTSILEGPLVEVVRSPRLWRILAHRYPDYVLAYRTALEPNPIEAGEIFLTGGRRRQIVTLPGVTVRFIPGPGPLPGDVPFVSGLYWASDARALLENLTVSRPRKGLPRSLGREAVQNRLEEIALNQGFGAMEETVRKAERLAPDLGLDKEAGKLKKMGAAIVGDRPARGVLARSRVLPRRAERPVSPTVEDRFHRLLEALRQTTPPPCPVRESPAEADRRAFVEAYFSNYIEGTRFPVDEARDIIFQGATPRTRPVEDTHDITSTYELARHRMTSVTPARASELTDQLLQRHRHLMAQRPEVRPGQFRDRKVSAGGYEFIEPALLQGTLHLGYEYLQALTTPMARATFTMFLVSEVHPFLDGNGRIARLAANAELSAAGEARFIVTTADRAQYISALRALSQSRDPHPLIANIQAGQQLTASLDFSDWDSLMAQLERLGAFAETG